MFKLVVRDNCLVQRGEDKSRTSKFLAWTTRSQSSRLIPVIGDFIALARVTGLNSLSSKALFLSFPLNKTEMRSVNMIEIYIKNEFLLSALLAS